MYSYMARKAFVNDTRFTLTFKSLRDTDEAIGLVHGKPQQQQH